MMDLVEQYRVKYGLSRKVYNTITLKQIMNTHNDNAVQRGVIFDYPDIDDLHGEGMVCAPRRSGKTNRLITRGVYTIATQQDHHILFIIPQWSGYRRIIMDKLDEAIAGSGLPEDQFTRREYMICNKKTGSEIILSNVNITPPVGRRLSSDIASNQQLLVLVDEPHYIIRERFVQYMEHIVLPEQPFRITAHGTPTAFTTNLGFHLERCDTIPNLVLRQSELV